MKTILFLILTALACTGCTEAISQDTETVTHEEHACHCSVKASKPEYFPGEACPMGDYFMQGHQMVKTPQGQIVRGVRCAKLEHTCHCEGRE